jgi:hypothetical protein
MAKQFAALQRAPTAADALPTNATIAGPARRVDVSGEPQWLLVKGNEVCVLLQGSPSSLTSGGPNSCIETEKLKADGGVLVFEFGSYPPTLPLTATPPPPRAPQIIAGVAEDGITSVTITFVNGAVVNAPVVDNGFQVATAERMPAEYRWTSADGAAHSEKGGS